MFIIIYCYVVLLLREECAEATEGQI